MDNRGHGASGGVAMDFGWWGERDLGGALDYLETRPDVHNGRIAILGESMGGEEAIGAIGRDARVKAVIAEGVTGRTFADTARLGNNVSGLISRANSWMGYTIAGILSRAPEPQSLRSSLRAAAPRQVLIIAGRDELQAGRYYQSASPSNVQLWEIPDSAHTAGLRTHPAEWEQHVTTSSPKPWDLNRV
jgi:pimeloyl-ACP methyl ester carboxylesterase